VVLIRIRAVCLLDVTRRKDGFSLLNIDKPVKPNIVEESGPSSLGRGR
jgi:hypothetical protein